MVITEEIPSIILKIHPNASRESGLQLGYTIETVGRVLNTQQNIEIYAGTPEESLVFSCTTLLSQFREDFLVPEIDK